MIKKVQLLANDGVTEIIPITSGSCVQMKNGNTLEQEIGETDRFSPIIETSTGMSKVGIGDGVDYSGQVKNGAYKECVFEGRTLVNLGLSKKIQITYNGNFVKEQLLKPNTTYTISYEIVAVSDNVTITNVPMFTQPVLPHTIGFHKMKRTTIGAISDTLFKIWGESDTLRTITIKNLTIIEGDYTNTDIPYFEGMCDVKMPILSATGKNLCNIEEYNNFEIYSQTVTKDGDSLILETLNENAWRYVTVSKVFLEAGKQYTISCNCEVLNATEQNLRGILVLWSIDHVNNISGDATNSNNFARTFTATESQEAYVKIYSSNGTGGIGNKIKYSNIQVEESPSKTPYEAHKTNILQTPEEIVLREVNGVKDTYNALTGEYVQRIGERVYEQGDELNSLVKTDMVNTQYGLAEPITTIVRPSSTPFAYENGHVILESGYDGQSLLPHLKYSVATNRTGMITQHNKLLLKQEQQLSNLEVLLLNGAIDLDYQSTLLTFKLATK